MHPDGDRSDQELWRDAQTGDAEALGCLFDRHARAVYNHAFRRTASWSAAEEVVQLTFLTAWRYAGRPDAPALRYESALPWLLTVAGNECRNLGRAGRRFRALLDRLPRERHEPDPAPEVAQRVDDERQMSAVRRAVRRLPRHERETLELVTWSGLSVAEAADALGVPVGTVKARLFRARSRLAGLLAPEALPEGEL
jgi:RNA polymerase sigma-70 factor (ECF subfamily)